MSSSDPSQGAPARSKEDIYASEAAFFDAQADGEVESRYGGDLRIRPEEHLEALRMYGLDGDLTGKRIVDCACGTGFFSVLLALRGADVYSFDLSERCVEVTSKRAEVNGVADRVHPVVSPFETVHEAPGFEPGTFDYVVGKNILHHIPRIEEAGTAIHELLRPGGQGIFYDLSANNPLLMFFRRNIIGKTKVIPKRGTPDEHPITQDEVDALAAVFDGRVDISYPKFRFFGKFDRQLFDRKYKLFTWLCDAIDRFIYRFLPPLRKYSYKILIRMTR